MHTEILGLSELGPWRKSSFSNPDGNDCVEVAFNSAVVGLRDSKNPDGPRLSFEHSQWIAFIGRTTDAAS